MFDLLALFLQGRRQLDRSIEEKDPPGEQRAEFRHAQVAVMPELQAVGSWLQVSCKVSG